MGKKTIRKRVEKPQEFDLDTFIKSQELEMDKDVAELFEEKPKERKKKKQVHESEEEEEEKMNSDEEAELEAYLELAKEEEEEEDDDEIQVKVYANKVEALTSRLSDIKKNVSWIDTQVITTPATEINANDDLERELGFYNQALKATNLAREKFIELNVPFERPADFFAEMVKTDEHMLRIRQSLLNEKKAIVEGEEKKRQRDLKKFGKKVQTEKLLQRQREKRQALDKIKHKKGNLEEDDFDVQVEKKNFKRQGKNKKYGMGGKKRFSKSNTAESTNEIYGFGGKEFKGGVSKKKGKKRQ